MAIGWKTPRQSGSGKVFYFKNNIIYDKLSIHMLQMAVIV